MNPRNDDNALVLSVEKESFSENNGRFILDPNLLPPICPRCGIDGLNKKEIRIEPRHDLKFWLPIVVFLGVPILLGIGTAFVNWIWGTETLQVYLAYIVHIAAVLVTLGLFNVTKSNKENWFLTFYFCNSCMEQYKKYNNKIRMFTWSIIIMLLLMITIAILESVLQLSQDTIQVLMWLLLIGIVGVITLFIYNKIKKRIF